MIENVKSAVLAFLVVLSLLQSYFLTFTSPKYDPINQNEYVQADFLGPQQDLDKLIFPEQIVLHTGKQAHTVIYPNTAEYKEIYEGLKQRTFENLRRVALSPTGANWEDVRQKQQGVELLFESGMPAAALGTTLQLKGDLPPDNEPVTKVWIFSKEGTDEVKAYFFTGTTGMIYEALKTNVTSKDVEEYVKLAENKPVYRLISGDIYLPDQDLHLYSYRIPYSQYSAEQLKKSLFVDPGITRNLTERDGSEIYTDGKRGLQIKNDQHWLSYSDPVVPVDNRADLMDNLLTAVQFINQHGGWNGMYSLDHLSWGDTGSDHSQYFEFRQWYGSYPIVKPKQGNYGYMKVTLQKSTVSHYERSTIKLDVKDIRQEDMQLPGGQVLEERVEAARKKGSLESVYPGYRPEVTDSQVVLHPAWVLEYSDGTIDYIE